MRFGCRRYWRAFPEPGPARCHEGVSRPAIARGGGAKHRKSGREATCPLRLLHSTMPTSPSTGDDNKVNGLLTSTIPCIYRSKYRERPPTRPFNRRGLATNDADSRASGLRLRLTLPSGLIDLDRDR